MVKVTVNETVSRSASFDNANSDISTATTRCFQFLEEKRFEEAHVIIEQILNIDPNNTNIHVANFLYHFKLTCVAEIMYKFENITEYTNSVFYKRIMSSSSTSLVEELNSAISHAKKRLSLEMIKKKIKKLCVWNALLIICDLFFSLFFLTLLPEIHYVIIHCNISSIIQVILLIIISGVGIIFCTIKFMRSRRLIKQLESSCSEVITL